MAIPSPKFLLPIPAARVGARSVSARKRKTKWGNGIAEIGRKKKIGNCGNAIAENGRKKNSG